LDWHDRPTPQPDSVTLLRDVGNSSLDLGILTHPSEIPGNVTVTQPMTDYFSIIGSSCRPLISCPFFGSG